MFHVPEGLGLPLHKWLIEEIQLGEDWFLGRKKLNGDLAQIKVFKKPLQAEKRESLPAPGET